jgi:hypothetical protein
MADDDSDSVPIAVADAGASTRDGEDDSKPATPAFVSMITSAAYGVPYRSLFFLFVLFILITSDVFAHTMLKKASGAIDDDGRVSPYGTVIQGLLLVIGYMILDFLISRDVL